MELLERADPLDELRELLAQAASGNGRLAIVGGEAGVGKTSLVQHFCRSVQQRATVLFGACDPLSTPTPLGPLLDIAPELGGELERLLQEAAPRQQVFGALLAELSSGPRPHLLVMEDLHWADEATFDLLRFLGRRLGTTRTLLLGTYRDDEVSPRHPLRIVLGDMATAGAVRRLTLQPLSVAAVATLVGHHGFDPVQLHRRTGGNPFFVAEVLAAHGRGVPATVRDAVLARVARLSSRARKALEAAAVIGARIEPALLERVEDADAESLDACVEAGALLTVGPSLAFRHELVREAVLDTLPAQRCADLHRRILRALIDAGVKDDLLARLAHHAEAADAGQAVLEYAPAAGRRAAQLGARRESAAQYERALRFADALPAEERARLLDAYAGQCANTNQLQQAADARREAAVLWHSVGNLVREGDSLARMAAPLVHAGRTPEGDEASLAALRVLETQPPGPELANAYSVQAGLRTHTNDDPEAIAWGERAIQLAERVGAVEPLVAALNMVGVARLHRGNEQGRADIERSLGLATEFGADPLVALAYANLGWITAEQYQFARAEPYLDQGIAYCAVRDLDHLGQAMTGWKALVQVHTGRWQAALDTAYALVHEVERAADGRVSALVATARVWTRQGDQRAKAALDEALTLAEPTGELQHIGPVRAARAERAWSNGDLEAVRVEAAAVLDLAIKCEQSWLVGELAYWSWRAGELDIAPPGAAEPFARQIGGDWAGAAALWQQLGCPYEQARALADSPDADPLRHALEIAEQLGAAPLAAKVIGQLRRLGIRRPPPRSPGRPAAASSLAPLSPREQEVATLVAQGCSNREIAERLVISERTTENHIQRILNRLGLRSRTQVATWTIQRGLNAESIEYRG